MNRIKCARALLLALALCLLLLPVIAQAVAERAEPAPKEYIYFDLAAGNVEIGGTTYSGSIFVNGEAKPVSGTHEAKNEYYIYQSTATNKSETGYKDTTDYTNRTNCRVPTYNRVQYNSQPWTEYITNNTKVVEVSTNWEKAAAQRTATPNYIILKQESGYTANVTIDNIWSNHHEASTSRTTGGIGAHLDNMEGTTINLILKGDNRVGCVHYSSDRGSGNQLIFSNGDDASKPGSITVADFPGRWGANHWNAVIGAADNPGFVSDMSEGIVIKGGVIYAGATPNDNCTAIGGGGNNYGSVTIDGGTVTAVTAGTGTAIGGGIGYSDPGGDTDVTINGGTIYAYNLGLQDGATDKFSDFVPAAAIGGGGSRRSAGGLEANITITGGTIYAQSMGGPGIGGGGSAESSGGSANITITGGTIIAKSTGGSYNGVKISAGASIGGGTGKTAGGSVTLTIQETNPEKAKTILRTGSIGGGKATGASTIGSATVLIEGGDITGQVIMAGTGDPNKKCSFTMTDGKLHSTNLIDGNKVTDIADPQADVPIQYLEKNGGAVWMADPIGVTNISGGTIEGCTAYLGGAVYMEGGTFTLSGDGTIQNNTARRGDGSTLQGYGGGVYVTGGTANIGGGSIDRNKAQVRGGGLYVTTAGTSIGKVNITKGFIRGNTAGFGTETAPVPADVGRGGGVYLEGGQFTMTGGEISGNSANYRGGGIFLTKKPTLTAGTISGNTAKDSGGGICVNGDAVELTSPAMKIFGNSAKNGGGVAVLGGSFTLNGGAVGIPGQVLNTATKGGGVYVSGGDAAVYSGHIWYNSAAEGGGVYLAKGEGDFTLNGADAVISHNTATSGGGVYLYKNPILNQGRIEANTATENGGGMFISDCLVTLKPTSDVIVTGNTANNGAGIYIHGNAQPSGGLKTSGSAVDAVTYATPTHRVGLLVAFGFTGTVSFTNNTATESGGAVCVNAGRFQLESDQITVTGNRAKNGGGVAVLHGNFTMIAGSIGEKNGANTATYGGGVYVSEGEVWLKGGSVEYNTATDGGGAYVTGGKMYMLDGSLAGNDATGNGGGAYVAGDFRMQGGTIGGEGGENHALNGGGVYVNEGNVTIVYGEITHNRADKDGGGFLVSAADNSVKVRMLSGSLSFNQAKANGGGMAVESSSDSTQTITVEIGCLRDHDLDADKHPQYPIEYAEAYADYAAFDGKTYEHESCPVVQGNQAGSVGGGFYMNSNASTLSFFCVRESENIAQDEDSGGMDVLGGKVIIGDEVYHNHQYMGGNNPERPEHAPWGYVSMDDATLVKGGQVDIYGDLTNPTFNKEIMVDIIDQNDHFVDHRRAVGTEKIYKVHYFENFKGTGRFESRDYHENDTIITVKGALFVHPGYKLLGWYTKPEYDPTENDPDNTFYEVGRTFDLSDKAQVPQMGQHATDCEHCGQDHNDTNLLGLYAIWEANGYTVIFDPNVPAGESFTGTMEDQVHEYDVEQTLTPNAYRYPGHFFKGWNTKADGSGTSFADGEKKIFNLTNQNGAKVRLYAQWEPCDHSVSERWTYDVIDDGKTLRRICSCGGQTLTATLYAQDTVYDGLPHPAILSFSDEAAWGTDKPEIVYKAEWLTDGLTHAGEAPALTADGHPYHAGVYTASITKPGEAAENKVTASAEYTIAKADQPAPSKPTYTVPEGTNKVVIDKLANGSVKDKNNVSHTAKAEYRLSYYADGVLKFTSWQPENTVTMENAWTSYNVEARYEELEDYKPSDVTRADAVYHYAGNVTVKIICDEGIEAYFDAKLNPTDKTLDGADLKLTLKTGYYLVGSDYKVTTELDKTADAFKFESKAFGEYSLSGVPDNSTLTITIGEAKKAPQSAGQVTPGQVFRPITGTTATVSRDSAFTAAFQITNFDPAAYAAPSLRFSANIPEDTTMILLNRRDGSYWYYRAAFATNSVPLTAFQKMGVSAESKYAVPAAGENGYIDLSYQFVVDFSQSTGGYVPDSLTVTLEATVKALDTTKAPAVNPAVAVAMKNTGFQFAKAPESGLTGSFTCTFEKGGAASKWENRASALVLTPKAGTELPPDARIQAVIGTRTVFLYKSGDSYIVPLSLLQNGVETVTLTLLSDLFPAEEKSYAFTAQWQISPSRAGKAPLIGDQADTSLDLTLTSPARKAPSLKSMGSARVLTGGELVLTMETLNMEGYTVSAELLRKSESGLYTGTGWNKSGVTGSTLTVPVDGQTPGSFCLMLTVKEKDSITTVMEVPYYFIIQSAQ